MSAPRPAKTLAEAYALLDPLRPLKGEWMAFYVPRPEESSIDPLRDELELDPSERDKTLFTGPRGSGKSTELNRLAEALRETHLVVSFTVENQLNLGDVNYADLLVLLGLKVFEAAQAAGVEGENEKLQALRYWYEEHIFEEDKVRRLDSEVGTEVNALIAKFSLKMSTDAPQRERIRATAQSHLADLLGRLNELLQEFRKRVGKRILVLVDGLDKVYDTNQVRDLFLQGANALLEPECRILYTIPFSLFYSNDFSQVRMSFPRFYALPNVKLYIRPERGEQPKQRYDPGWEMLREVLYRRMDPSLLTEEATDYLIHLSGGVIRELISLARSSLVRARRLRGDHGPIEVEDVEHAARQVQNAFRTQLTEEQYRALAALYRGGPFINSLVMAEVLHNLSLLEYNGEGRWWAVHPIVEPLIREWIENHEAP